MEYDVISLSLSLSPLEIPPSEGAQGPIPVVVGGNSSSIPRCTIQTVGAVYTKGYGY